MREIKAQIETTSDEKATCFPSTAKQLDLARYLVTELEAIGLSEVELTEHGYVVATLPANTEEALPGFLRRFSNFYHRC